MPVPDISTLTEAELITLAQNTDAALRAKQATEQTNQAALLDPTTVQTAITKCETQVTALKTLLATTNADINASPAQHIKTLARATKVDLNNTIRLLRTSAGILDSTSIGDES